LQIAARFLLDEPRDVALLSMREQAKRAGVLPATMTRLAGRLGFSGYEEIRRLFAECLRRGADGFSDRARNLVDRHRVGGDVAIAMALFDAVGQQVGALRTDGNLQTLSSAAKDLAKAQRIFVLGQRSSYPVAYQFAYSCSLIGCDTRLVDSPGGIGIDLLQDGDRDDVFLVISIRPYARASLTIAQYAVQRKIPLIAITDSQMSPFAEIASASVIVGVESPSFFHSMAPAFAAVEAIAALIAALKGDTARDALTKREQEFDHLQLLLMQRKPWI
jgi:DNA-binding MurR/RpiR family transcriptional regulator